MEESTRERIYNFLENKKETRDDIAELSYVLYSKKENSYISSNENILIYPASVSKLLIAGGILKQIENGTLDIRQTIKIAAKNINKEDEFYVKIKPDFMDFKVGEYYTINQLLSAMLGQSNNSASNTLIDIIGRDYINQVTVLALDYPECILTRKFNSREHEDIEYKNAPITKGTVKCYIEIWKLIDQGKFISTNVSEKILEYTKQEKESNKGLSLFSQNGSLYRKGGWLSSVLQNKNTAFWEHDTGVYKDNNDTIIFSIFTLVKNSTGSPFGLNEFR